MEGHASGLVLVFTTLLLGLAHGIDWDHIAAITDITGSVAGRGRGFWLATLYALGHAFVVSLLGVLAILAGLALPQWVDRIMGPAVGLTLLFLAAWIIYSLFQSSGEFQLRSRWMLFFDWLQAMGTWAIGHLRGEPRPFQLRDRSAYGAAAAFGIGMLHGIGAETATQAFLFVAVAGIGGRMLGSLMLGAFVLGLVLSNSAITIATLYGFELARRNQIALRVLGGFVAAFSLAIGLFFITGHEALLPKIIGWRPSLF